VDDFVIPEAAAKHRPSECNGKSDNECFEVLTWLGKNPFEVFDPNPPPPGFAIDKPTAKPPFDPSRPYLEGRDKERQAAIRFGATLAFVPPVLVLIMGLALSWVVKGFRS
jgi:hypothetical protein